MTELELQNDLKNLVIESLKLRDLTPADIDVDAPLFGAGLGLDSIDALELGFAIKKKYGLSFSSDAKDNQKYFASIKNLAEFVRTHDNKAQVKEI